MTPEDRSDEVWKEILKKKRKKQSCWNSDALSSTPYKKYQEMPHNHPQQQIPPKNLAQGQISDDCWDVTWPLNLHFQMMPLRPVQDPVAPGLTSHHSPLHLCRAKRGGRGRLPPRRSPRWHWNNWSDKAPGAHTHCAQIHDPHSRPKNRAHSH